MQRLVLTGLPWQGKIPLRDVRVNPIIEKGEGVIVYCAKNGKKYQLSNEELKNPLYSMDVGDFKNKTNKEVHQLHYYPLNEVS